MENPDVTQISQNAEKLKADMIYSSNFNVADKKLMHQWIKYFDQQLKGAANVQTKHDCLHAFKIMSEIGRLLPPFNIPPNDKAQKIIKGPRELTEFSKRFHPGDFRDTMKEYVDRQTSKKKQTKTVVTNKKVVEEPGRTTTISTTLEVSLHDPTTSRPKSAPMNPEIKKEKMANIKAVENHIMRDLLADQIPEAVQIFKYWINIFSTKLNREADLDNRLRALLALRKCAENSIIAEPFDVVPKGNVLNIREFLRQLDIADMDQNIETAIKGIEIVESILPDEILETGGAQTTKMEGKVPPIINQRMRILPLKQQIYDVKKSIEYAIDYIDPEIGKIYQKWSNIFERGLSSGYKEMSERLEFEKECDICLNKGTLPDFMYDEEPPEAKKLNMSKAREYLRKIKEFNGSDLFKFPEIVDYQSLTQQERKEMMLKRREEQKKKKFGAIPKIPKVIMEVETPKNLTSQEIQPELADPLVKNDVLKTITTNMLTALDAIVHENLEDLTEIPEIVDQVKDAVQNSPYKKGMRLSTYEDVMKFHRSQTPAAPKASKKSPVDATFVPFSLDVSPDAKSYGPLSSIPVDEGDLFDESAPKIDLISSEDDEQPVFTPQRVSKGFSPLKAIIGDDDDDLLNISEPDFEDSLNDRPRGFEAFTPLNIPLIKVDAPNVTKTYHDKYEPIPDEIKSFVSRMVRKELVHWPIFLQEFGQKLKWSKDKEQTGRLIFFSP